MISVAFDTNIWLNFVENVDIDYLSILADNVEDDKLEIILPENIELEFKKKIDNVKRKTIINNQTSLEQLDNIIDTIFDLFINSKKLPAIELDLLEWITSGLAPNHNSENYQDTLVLNTLLQLPKNYSLHFVSLDSHFRIDKENYNLHPYIIEKFKKNSIDIKFYTDHKVFFVRNKLFPNKLELLTHQLYDWKTFKLRIKNKTILEQLHQAIEYYYKELDFIPLSYLSNIYPFNIGNFDQTYFQGTTLITNNKELFSFFKSSLKKSNSSIQTSNFKSKSDVKKFEKVLLKLNLNLVFGIRYKKEFVNIELKKNHKKDKCQCIQCTFYRNDVKSLLSKCTVLKTDSHSNLLKKAYYLYKIRHLKESYKIINSLITTVNKIDHPIIYFIVQYNLNVLSKMWFEGDDDFEIIRNKIKPENENNSLKSGLFSITGYLKYSKYFDYKFYELSEDFDKVKERYLAHNGYGNSYYSNIDNKNIIRWAELIYLIENNGIFFDIYSNIKRFAKLTLHLSLLASEDNIIKYPVSEYLLRTTLLHIPLQDLKNIFSELNIDILNYDRNKNKEIFEWFCDKIDNLDQSVNLGYQHSYLKIHEKEIEKLIYLQSHLKFSKKQDNIIISKLISLIKLNDYYQDVILSLLNTLVKNKKNCFNIKNAKAFIDLIFNFELNFNSNIQVVFILLENFRSLHLKDSQFQKLLNDDVENKTGFFKGYVLLQLYEVGSKSHQDVVLKKVHNTLQKQERFDYKLYAFFTNEGIIPVEINYLNMFKNNLHTIFKRDRKIYYSIPYDGEIKKIEILDYFINHIYLFYAKDAIIYLNEYKGHSDYYDFLINPNDFETSKIEIHWLYIAFYNSFNAIKHILNSYPTINDYFLNEILKSNNIKYYEAFLKCKKSSQFEKIT